MTRMEEKMQGMETLLKEIRDRLGKIEEKTERIENKIKDQNKIISKMEAVLEEVTQMKKEIDLIKVKNMELTRKINTLEKGEEQTERKMIRNKMEIIGIPESPMENIKELVMLIANQTEVKVSGEDIGTCYREKNRSGKEGRIIAEFRNSQIRDKIMVYAKKKKLRLKDINREPADRNVYVNELLTKKTREIFYHAKQIVRDKKWSKIWIYAGTVHIKQENTGNQIKVESMDEVEVLRK